MTPLSLEIIREEIEHKQSVLIYGEKDGKSFQGEQGFPIHINRRKEILIEFIRNVGGHSGLEFTNKIENYKGFGYYWFMDRDHIFRMIDTRHNRCKVFKKRK